MAIITRWVYKFLLGATLVFLIAPALLVVVLSFSNDPAISFPPATWGVNNYGRLMEQPSWHRAATLSLVLALGVAFLSVLVAVPAAYGLERTRLSRLGLLSFVAILPMLMPQAAYAIGIYMMMAKFQAIGTPQALVAAHLAICFPYVFLVTRSQLTRIPRDLELVAMTMGASRPRAALGVTLRLALPAALSGGMLAFLTSFDEAVFASFLAGPGLITLPKAIFDSVRLGVDPVITAVATLLMAFTAAVLAAATLLRREGAAA